MQELPLVSIVTPSLNMARYLDETIQSVLSQDYPRIEYIVMDGGSTDGTLDILRKYCGAITYQSSKDDGAADAVNKGFRTTRGEIIAYLNADDVYCRGAVSTAVRKLMEQPEAAVVYGDAQWIDCDGNSLGRYPTRDFNIDELYRECFICQPASFMRRSAFEAAGGLDPDLQFTFDYDLWIRLARTFRIVHIPEILAKSRMHIENKTLGSRGKVFKERISMLRKETGYAGFAPVYAYACYLMDGRDQFFEPLQPTVLKYMFSLAMGMMVNGLISGRFMKEWARVMKSYPVGGRRP